MVNHLQTNEIINNNFKLVSLVDVLIGKSNFEQTYFATIVISSAVLAIYVNLDILIISIWYVGNFVNDTTSTTVYHNHFERIT